jgi:hypothetical protein
MHHAHTRLDEPHSTGKTNTIKIDAVDGVRTNDNTYSTTAAVSPWSRRHCTQSHTRKMSFSPALSKHYHHKKTIALHHIVDWGPPCKCCPQKILGRNTLQWVHTDGCPEDAGQWFYVCRECRYQELEHVSGAPCWCGDNIVHPLVSTSTGRTLRACVPSSILKTVARSYSKSNALVEHVYVCRRSPEGIRARARLSEYTASAHAPVYVAVDSSDGSNTTNTTHSCGYIHRRAYVLPMGETLIGISPIALSPMEESHIEMVTPQTIQTECSTTGPPMHEGRVRITWNTQHDQPTMSHRVHAADVPMYTSCTVHIPWSPDYMCPICMYSSPDDVDSSQSCLVEHVKTMRALPCLHLICSQCIKTWFIMSKSTRCPICRTCASDHVLK